MRGRGSGNSDEFIREVDEAVRQDRWLRAVAALRQLSRRSGARGGARHRRRASAGAPGSRAAASRRPGATPRPQQLLRQDRAARGGRAFAALAEDADSGYGVIARLRAAEAQAQAGDRAAASDALDRLASDAETAPVYRQLGDLLRPSSSWLDHAGAGVTG